MKQDQLRRHDYISFQQQYFFSSKITDHGRKYHEKHGLTFEKLKRLRDEWNKSRIEPLGSFNNIIHQKKEVSAYITKVDEPMFE